MLPMIIVVLTEAKVSLSRIKKYLHCSNLKERKEKISERKCTAIKMKKASFFWDDEFDIRALTQLDFTVTRGSLLLIIGMIGSGKSALLKSIIGELKFNGLYDVH